MNYTAPHDPWLTGHPTRYTELYDDCEFPSVPRTERHPWSQARSDFDEAFAQPEPRLVGYCASLTAVDEGFGTLLDELESIDELDRTVVVFMSDNGFACGHHGLWGKGNGSWPLNFWDTSVRVPAIVRVPGGATGRSEALVSATSLHATICDLAGVSLPPDAWGSGRSIAPVLRGDETTGAALVVVGSEYGSGRMITDGSWVYVTRRDGPDELYDRAADPDEQHNLTGNPEYASVETWLSEALQQWWQPRDRPGLCAWGHDVTGYGQIHPLSRGRDDDETYACSTSSDGNPDETEEAEERRP